jgi:CRP/FNR family transcriptional regulator, cyclic AMP receptor protein
MSKNEVIVSLLSRTALFGGLPVDEIAACAASFQETHFAKGEMLFARGEAGTRLYLLAEGRVRLAIVSEEGRELSFRVTAPGELFGEIAALDGSPRSADATALTPVTTFSLEHNAFRALWSTRSAIAAAVIAFLCRRLRETTSQLEAIALHPLDVRLARFLQFALGSRQAQPGKRVPLELGFSQGELAQMLGATRPKVNLALGELENAGAIVRTLDRLFCDPVKLAEIARQDDV